MEDLDIQGYVANSERSRLKKNEEIQRLKEENLDLQAHVDHLSEQVERSKNIEDKLRKELDLSKRNEEGLKRELVEAKESRTRIDSSTEKLDHMISV
jgi:peptidoglycan hydrolase CwlO-like protein